MHRGAVISANQRRRRARSVSRRRRISINQERQVCAGFDLENPVVGCLEELCRSESSDPALVVRR